MRDPTLLPETPRPASPGRRAHAAVLGAAHRVAWLPPLLLRAILGVAFVETGWGKLQHLDQITAYFAQLGIPLAGVQAPFVAGVELVGGALLVLGLGTRVAAALLTGVMAVAIGTAVWPTLESWRDLLSTREAIYLATFVYLAVHGAGRLSLDTLIARRAGLPAALRTQTQE